MKKLKILEHYPFQCITLCFETFTNSVTPWTVARQASLSMGFPRQEFWSGLPCLPPRDRTSVSCLAGEFFTAEPPGATS